MLIEKPHIWQHVCALMSSSSCAIGHRTTPPGCRLCGDIVNAQREAQPDPDRAFQASTDVRRYGASQLGARKAKQFDHEHSQLGDIWQKVEWKSTRLNSSH